MTVITFFRILGCFQVKTMFVMSEKNMISCLPTRIKCIKFLALRSTFPSLELYILNRIPFIWSNTFPAKKSLSILEPEDFPMEIKFFRIFHGKQTWIWKEFRSLPLKSNILDRHKETWKFLFLYFYRFIFFRHDEHRLILKYPSAK